MFLRKKSKGQSLVEYALILALVSIACIGALQGVTGGIQGKLGEVATALQ
ncbi:MAG: Flp family type IVb pilin [Vampirovibrionales bacterium]